MECGLTLDTLFFDVTELYQKVGIVLKFCNREVCSSAKLSVLRNSFIVAALAGPGSARWNVQIEHNSMSRKQDEVCSPI